MYRGWETSGDGNRKIEWSSLNRKKWGIPKESWDREKISLYQIEVWSTDRKGWKLGCRSGNCRKTISEIMMLVLVVVVNLSLR